MDHKRRTYTWLLTVSWPDMHVGTMLVWRRAHPVAVVFRLPSNVSRDKLHFRAARLRGATAPSLLLTCFDNFNGFFLLIL